MVDFEAKALAFVESKDETPPFNFLISNTSSAFVESKDETPPFIFLISNHPAKASALVESKDETPPFNFLISKLRRQLWWSQKMKHHPLIF